MNIINLIVYRDRNREKIFYKKSMFLPAFGSKKHIEAIMQKNDKYTFL